jgi:glutamate dehydrogenase
VRIPLIVKANRIAQVHRRVPLDLFLVPVVEGGQITALSVHAGVWTSAALAATPDRVPRMRSQLEALMSKLGFDPAGHAGKALVHALTALPHDLLISFSDADLERIATTMMVLVDRPRPRLALVRAPLERHLYAFVWQPRDSQSTQVREQVTRLLEQATGGQVIDWALQVEGSTLALTRFAIDMRGEDDTLTDGGEGWTKPRSTRVPDPGARLGRGGGSRTGQDRGRDRAAAIAARYAPAFPVGYRASYGAAEAAGDIRVLRALTADDAPRRAVRLHRLAGEIRAAPEALSARRRDRAVRRGARAGKLRLPRAGGSAHRARPRQAGLHPRFPGGPPGRYHARGAAGARHRDRGSLAAVLNGAAEDDAFNRLIVAVGLTATEANWLRAWYRYLRQAGMTFGIATVVDALKNAPDVTRGLIGVFRARHDPAFVGDRKAPGMPRPSRSAPAWPSGRDQRRSPAAQFPRAGRGDPAHQRLCPGRGRSAGLQDRFRAGPRPAQAGAVARDLRLFPARGRHPPARRAGGARRPALV